jgi:hypothetical protein
MAFLEDLKRHIGFSWKKGFLMIAYFLLFGILNILVTNDNLFIIFAWPFYLLPSSGLMAASLQMLYIYLVATIILALIEKKKHS